MELSWCLREKKGFRTEGGRTKISGLVLEIYASYLLCFTDVPRTKARESRKIFAACGLFTKANKSKDDKFQYVRFGLRRATQKGVKGRKAEDPFGD